MEVFVYIGLGIIIGAAVATTYFLFANTKFKLTAQEAVHHAHEAFLQRAEETFKRHHADGRHDLDKRSTAIGEMIKPIEEKLKNLDNAIQQVSGTNKALNENLMSFSKETAKLVGALRDPAAQGKWGEYILEKLLDDSGLMKGVHYHTQLSMNTEAGRRRPDAVIHMQDGFHIIIDAKAPINEQVQRLSENLTEDENAQIRTALARQIKLHVNDLGKKSYWENLESPDFTVLFLPSEQLYSAALRADPTLIDHAAAQNIIIASPTLLMSLLRVVGMSWRQVELAKSAQDISALGAELYKAVGTFKSHMEKIGRALASATGSYNDAVGSLERNVLTKARKFEDFHAVPPGKSLEEIPLIENSPRSLEIANETAKKRA